MMTDINLFKTAIKRIVGIAGVCTFTVIIWMVLRYLVIDDTKYYTRVMMHEFYEQENIDIVFCGASLCYRTFDPGVLDTELEVNTFNTGSSSQPIDVTYYLLKECLNRNKVKRVFVELSPIMASGYNDESRSTSDMASIYIISDYMKNSLPKLQLLLKTSATDQYANSFLDARRNWQSIYDTDYVGSLIEKKTSETYSDYGYDNLKYDTEYYKGKGFVESISTVSEGAFNDYYSTINVRPDNIKETWYGYVQDIIELCENRNVELTFVCAPLSEYLLASYGESYNAYHDRIASIAEQAGIEFWDFSLAKNDYFPADANNYMDSAHLNMYGAQIFNKLISKIINGEISYKDICCQSVEEKISHDIPRVLGLRSDGVNKSIIATRSDILNYTISVTTSEGNEYTIQDFSPNKDFCVNEGEHGTIHITCLGDDQSEKLYEYSY